MELIESICREWSPDFDALRPRQQAQLRESALACLLMFEKWLRQRRSGKVSEVLDELAAMRKEGKG